MESITLTQSKRLVELEDVIARGKQAFIDVGNALAEIRDNRLYKADYDSFEDYCREKWGWTKTYCNNLIVGAETVQSLPVKMTTIVVNEGQARELSKVPEAKREQVIKKASEQTNGKVTAKAIREAAKPAKVSQVRTVTTEPEPVEKSAAKAHEQQPEKTPAMKVVEDLRAIADRLEADELFPAPGERVDYTETANELILCAKTLRKLAAKN